MGGVIIYFGLERYVISIKYKKDDVMYYNVDIGMNLSDYFLRGSIYKVVSYSHMELFALLFYLEGADIIKEIYNFRKSSV